MSSDSFTGRGKRRTTRKSVLVAERAARFMITVGGTGTIVAVSLIMLFLIWVVAPLWAPAQLDATGSVEVEGTSAERVALGVDAARRIGWVATADGLIRAHRVDDGSLVDERRALQRGGAELRCAATGPGSDRVAAGYSDGRVLLGLIGFDDTILAEQAEAGESLGMGVEPVPASLRGLPEGELASHDGGVVARMSDDKLLLRRIDVRTLEPLPIFEGVPVVRVAATGKVSLPTGAAPEVRAVVAAVSAAGDLAVQRVGESFDLFAGEVVRSVKGREYVGAVPEGRGAPAHLFLTRLGDHALLVWEDGFARHFLFRDGDLTLEAEIDLFDGREALVTDVKPLLGETTVVVADDGGRVTSWFPARPAALEEKQALELAVRAYQSEIYRLRSLLSGAGVPDHELPFAGIEQTGLTPAMLAALSDDEKADAEAILTTLGPLFAEHESARAALIQAERQRFVAGAEIVWRGDGFPTAIAASDRSRTIAIGGSSGSVALAQVNAGEIVGKLDGVDVGVDALVMAPKEDGLLVHHGSRVTELELDPGHPEASFGSLFGTVWYEGLDAPSHVWQSTGGTDAFEPKLGLMPLVFGTIKATLYSMLFGAPLALLAAIYSSEFLKPRLRATLKSILELMASLPSVVLGFLAALIIAPYVQEVLPGMLAFFMVLPFTLVLGANLWQLLPRRRAILWSGWQRFAAIVLALPTAVWLAGLVGPFVENLFFAGNIELWLDGQLGTGAGGWLLLFLPLSALGVVLLLGRVVNPRIRAASQAWEPGRTARAELFKFLAAAAATIVVAIVLASITSAAGFDPRGTVVDSYVQRNALVVGFVMGFAVIPIIYTLAEDALTSVPEHLRLASLGCGATPWQTAVRVIVPTAMSGLFSAVMIGLGRAVGETMIVLMAAGNTPVMDWNIFNGFRTLSANIAVELPEAARDTTHYRVLFLAALTLFLMTFVLNTLAEVVRSRFRKRAFQL